MTASLMSKDVPSTGPLGRALAVAFAGLWCAIVAVAGRATPLAEALGAVSTAVLFWHAVVKLGVVEAVAFAAVCLGVTFPLEAVGVATGFPFGHYAFLVDPLLPRIANVPLVVGPLYFGMGYAAWTIANFLLEGRIVRPTTGARLVVLPVTAAFVMTQWDVVTDPSGSTLARAWVWYRGGGYFGVPLSNFLGWFLITYLYFQGFALVQWRLSKRGDYRERGIALEAAPALLYLASGLCHLPPLWDPPATLTDGGGRVWAAQDLRETAVIVMLFTMLPSALLALYRLSRRSAPGDAQGSASKG